MLSKLVGLYTKQPLNLNSTSILRTFSRNIRKCDYITQAN